jgi:3-hydroxyacyl-[acyl-carrier-protein] dehydratase
MSAEIKELSKKIIDSLPYRKDFLFVDEIIKVNDSSIWGYYTFKQNEFFVNAHFKHIQVTPGVILIEMMGQIGLVCHLVYLMGLYKKTFLYHPIIDLC